MSLITTALGLGGKAVSVGTGLLGPRLYVEAAVVGVLLATIGSMQWSRHTLQAEKAVAEAQAATTLSKWNAQVAEGVRVAFQAAELARAEESRREAARRENVDEAQRMAARGRADRVVADGAHERLLERAADTVRAAGGGEGGRDPAAAQGSSPAAGAGLVLTGVLGRVDDVAGELAAALDEARTAGLACERAYDSLTVSPPE